MITNPILPGFHPDPSMCRVGDTYYIATSTFEWYPGVRIYRSTDLTNWEFCAAPLDRADLLDMRGNPDSGGVWAPCLSYADGRFWLVYTDVKRLDGSFKDAHNYITSCETIDGRWSDRIYVHSYGFDPSLFHDDDGRKWVVTMRWNHRGPGTGCNPAHDSFDGILLQEWHPERGLIGEPVNIFAGTPRGLTEAPHLFKRGGYYYLTTAEGGTGYRHAVTLARSRDIAGPYEVHPDHHVMSVVDTPDHPIQRTGHGQYVEAPDGTVWHSFLMGRPIAGPEGKGRFCPLGRESGIERCVWGDDDWLYLEAGGLLAREHVPSDAEQEPLGPSHYRFDGDSLPDDFQWLRTPETDRIFRVGGGALTLIGRESIGSWFEQSLVARRQQHFRYRAETEVDIDPITSQHMAGLTTYYNSHKFHALMVGGDGRGGRELAILSCPGDFPYGELDRSMPAPVALPDGPVRLAVEVDRATQQFFYAVEGGDWQAYGPPLDASQISDEGGKGEHRSFTGAFVGLASFDTTGMGGEARFPWFSYVPN
ncbi:glycoside hydrolase family 43 protein [Shimia biformata]|uniref:glycoside hydrolase family 43 protein n=1 Tax=Shimia biformata TaxID=1294299 RepID=UPI0019518DBE|nr:glycoside hydrolase family 43 protein [Shimia biformata]